MRINNNNEKIFDKKIIKYINELKKKIVDALRIWRNYQNSRNFCLLQNLFSVIKAAKFRYKALNFDIREKIDLIKNQNWDKINLEIYFYNDFIYYRRSILYQKLERVRKIASIYINKIYNFIKRFDKFVADYCARVLITQRISYNNLEKYIDVDNLNEEAEKYALYKIIN